ncbi:MAG: hypothetical protein QM755_17070 [Luteolibacter sp.]
MIRALAATLLLLVTTPLHAQLSEPPAGEEEAPKPAAVQETPQQTRDRWQAWSNDAKAQLVRLDDPAAETQLPEGVTTNEYADRRRDMQSMVASLERCLKSAALLEASAKDATRAREARADWHGFKELLRSRC